MYTHSLMFVFVHDAFVYHGDIRVGVGSDTSSVELVNNEKQDRTYRYTTDEQKRFIMSLLFCASWSLEKEHPC